LLKKLDIELSKKGDLVYHEGPVLSHFVDEQNRDYFMLWVDGDEKYNRWLLFYLNSSQLKSFFGKRKSLKQLITENEFGFVYLTDIDDKIKYQHIYKLAAEGIPKDYLPKENSKFDPDQYEKYSKELETKVETKLKETHEHLEIDYLLKKFSEDVFGKRNEIVHLISLKSYENTLNQLDEKLYMQALTIPIIINFFQKFSETKNEKIFYSTKIFLSYAKNDFEFFDFKIGFKNILSDLEIKSTRKKRKEIFEILVDRARETLKHYPDYKKIIYEWSSAYKGETESIQKLLEPIEEYGKKK
jgi:hypothetical protein